MGWSRDSNSDIPGRGPVRKIIEAEGTHNCVICLADERKNYFVQFGTGKNESVVRAEAVSNAFLKPRFRLGERQVKTLRSMGWKAPKPNVSPNFYRDWGKGAGETLEMARHAMQVLSEIYGARTNRKLKIEVVLESAQNRPKGPDV